MTKKTKNRTMKENEKVLLLSIVKLKLTLVLVPKRINSTMNFRLPDSTIVKSRSII